ncbi:MAG: galactokinase [candidate division KSB1 bacterium]|nr:galactokinase [candidate division KSB1 bacterium]MDZ7334140.1 galactokinase [candidate division KSB1 bacterium]MDZ7357388.1 galactokinase [candidate division KSB1 bacterium]MDZ7401364.1 galactokinase [candidate division KSB1 bacterium]
MISTLQNLRSVFKEIYCTRDDLVIQSKIKRFDSLIEKFNQMFHQTDLHLFSTPGRTEIGGNHTDHNHGRVLAASVNLDSIAVAAINQTNTVTVHSEGYPQPFVVNLDQLDKVAREVGTTSALIRGIAARFKQSGFHIGGFNAVVTSDVLPGSGLSSSASIEVLIGTIFNSLFNNNSIPAQTIALIGQYAENEYFGKPCGLMDQTTCAVGGIITIDFLNPKEPTVRKVHFDFASQNYSLLVVDTGGNHADLTDEYAAVPQEMKAVARELGAEVCRQIRYHDLIAKINEIRSRVGDRAILRAIHFIGDNTRVLEQVSALEKGDFKRFLMLVNESGNSSFKWLQNIYTTKNIREQGVALALAVTEKFISDLGEGACRVHGGGFAGTIQVFLPISAVTDYIQLIESIYGTGKALVLSIRPHGSLYLNQFLS